MCDVLPLDIDPVADGFDDVWTVEDLGYDRGWIFKHNVMELCTAVKGHALERLMAARPNADLYVYLDPDVYVYDDLAKVQNALGDASVGLVPHILWPEETDIGVRMTEMSVTEHGIYNLGHLFVRGDKIGRSLAAWWRTRLNEYCYDDREFGLFTDQRWMDLVPAIFDNVRIMREPVYDVASWNLFGRTITQESDVDGIKRFLINGQSLITYHFSGTGPAGTHTRVRQIFAACSGGAAEIERDYEATIQAYGQKWLERLTPAYDLYSDGTPIKAEARKLYRQHTDLQKAFTDPYEDGFRTWLKEHRPALVQGIILNERRSQQAFEELFDSAWYLETYPDVRTGVAEGNWQDALDHYIRVGSALLYDPNPIFVSSFYYERAKYIDGHLINGRIRSREKTLLWHYITVGLANGIEPAEHFDSNWYINTYDDIRCAYQTGEISVPLAHYMRYGDVEWRRPGPNFDPHAFVNVNPKAQILLAQNNTIGPFRTYLRWDIASARASV